MTKNVDLQNENIENNTVVETDKDKATDSA